MRNRVLGITVMLVTVFAITGCSTKKDDDFEDELLPEVSDADAAGTSLGEFQQHGRVGGGESGPLGDIHFAYDSHDLSQEAMSTLQRHGEYLRERDGVKVEVEGHCDERGTIEYNLALGAKRARAARDYLVALGVSADRLTTISYGEELPLCYEQNDGCWQRNRRVHFVVRGE